jgi:hypothetical protein
MRSRTIEEFVSEVERGIGKTVPAERRAEIVAETQAHLEDRTEDLAFGGATSRERAEEEALTAFGEAKTYAQSVAESFYEDRPRRKARKLALWAAFLCVGIPMVLAGLGNELPYTRNAFGSEGTVFWVTLTVALSLVLGFLGRRRQTLRLAGIGATLFAAFFIVMGLRYTTDSTGSVYKRSSLRATLMEDPGGAFFQKYMGARLALLKEAQAVFTSPKPIPATWKTADGLYPAPWPKRPQRYYGLSLQRMTDKDGKSQMVSESVATSEAEARRRWRESGNDAIREMQVYIRRVNQNRTILMGEWRAMLGRPFDPMAALQPLLGAALLWLLMVFCDALGAWLGRWVFRKTWKKGPSRPKTGTAA